MTNDSQNTLYSELQSCALRYLVYSISEDEKKVAFIGSFRTLKSTFLGQLVVSIARRLILIKFVKVTWFTKDS